MRIIIHPTFRPNFPAVRLWSVDTFFSICVAFFRISLTLPFVSSSFWNCMSITRYVVTAPAICAWQLTYYFIKSYVSSYRKLFNREKSWNSLTEVTRLLSSVKSPHAENSKGRCKSWSEKISNCFLPSLVWWYMDSNWLTKTAVFFP